MAYERKDPFPYQEYKTPHGETISVQQNSKYGWYEVSNDTETENRWFLTFDKQEDAVKEFERWR